MGVFEMLMFYFILFTSVNGFLLDSQQSNGGKTSPANEYMTLSKFMEEEKRLQQKIEYLQQDTTTLRQNLQQDTTTLRHDMDNSFVVLTAQLQQKLDLMDTKLADIEKNNVTNQDVSKLIEKNKALEKSYNDLKNKNAMLTNELKLLKNNTKHLDELQTRLYNDVRTNLSILGRESEVLRNKSLLVDQDISNLKQLGSIQPLQEIKTLQQTVQVISSQTHSLSMKERARSQDFLALYNMTTNSLNELDVRTQSKIKQLENDRITSVRTIDRRVDTLINETRLSQYNVGTQLSNIQSDFVMKLQETERRDNLTFHSLQKQINDSTELVSMTAYATPSTSVPGIIKFRNIKFNVGISNLTAYRNTGKFVCERKGLYMISSSIMCDSNTGDFYIYLNNVRISETYVLYTSNNPSGMRHSSTVVLALQLLPNDSVWVYKSDSCTVYSGLYSTFTILKIK